MEEEKKVRKLKQINIVIAGKVYENWGRETITMDEGEALEQIFGGTVQELGEALDRGGAKARRVIAWGLLRRDQPDLRYDDVKLPLGDFVMDLVFEEEEEDGAPFPTSGVPDETAPLPDDASDTSLTSPVGSTSDPLSGST